MEGESKPPVLVKVTQYAFILLALVNAWWMVAVATMRGDPDDMILTGRLTLLSVILFVASVIQIGNRSKYARALTIAVCILMSFRAARRLYLNYQARADDDFVMFVEMVFIFETFFLVNIMLYLSIASFFAFSPKVVRYFHPDREPKFSEPPPPPSFDA